MKRPFPVVRTDTITRANVERALLAMPSVDDPEKLADYLCGVGQAGNSYAKARHVERCRRLVGKAKAPVTRARKTATTEAL